ncbi:uncharacterized protein I303_101447 [Kwoniella dejecticola CBS 10117]|uniref:Flavin reductase like domain-containing protein n=1 Tax=Kwoniella dejecticola CBS 10117 TaxID=1296121 RepID=A0A1A6AHS3_9TREE|nr:uncharacterized protein I303_01456 [Kwoniella dejecticola CBS 10117]OBR89627.1 hypothetical protein I303_01456 [Kwoniella dejecticola CBS 10117]
MTIRPPFSEVEAARPDFDPNAELTWTKVPQPDFKAGGGLNTLPYSKDFAAENAKWVTIDPAEHEKSSMYKLMISGITPRPIAFMSTRSEDGVCNLAPMSYFNMVSHNPPTIMVSVMASATNPDGLKDTSKNIKDTGEFCCSIISETFMEAASYTSIDTPPGIEEWALSGLTKRRSRTVKPPHVAESAFSMECRLEHWYDLKNDDGKVTGHVILGRINCFQAKDFLFDPAEPMKVLPERLRAVSRLGGVTFGRTLAAAEAPRPYWEQVKDSKEVQAAIAAGSKTVE